MATIKLEVTEAQLKAIKEMADTLSAMLGCSDEGSFDTDVKRQIMLIDRMLKKNKLAPRKFS